MSKTLLSIGHGYVARHLADTLRPLGWQVIGTSRRADGLREIETLGDSGLLWPGGDIDAAIAQASHVLVSVPPAGGSCPVAAALGEKIAQAGPDWVGYFSTTGVYGDTDGGWVDETTPPDPTGPRGAARLASERAWGALPLPLHVFRLPGIYGPGRSAVDKLRDGTARRIVKPGQVFSRIHVDDICAALRLSMARPMPGAVWNIADDEPAAHADVVAEAARLLGIAPPTEEPLDTAGLSPMGRDFYSQSRRVSNTKAKADLGWAPAYPDYRAGLRAIIASGA